MIRLDENEFKKSCKKSPNHWEPLLQLLSVMLISHNLSRVMLCDSTKSDMQKERNGLNDICWRLEYYIIAFWLPVFVQTDKTIDS